MKMPGIAWVLADIPEHAAVYVKYFYLKASGNSSVF